MTQVTVPAGASASVGLAAGSRVIISGQGTYRVGPLGASQRPTVDELIDVSSCIGPFSDSCTVQLWATGSGATYEVIAPTDALDSTGRSAPVSGAGNPDLVVYGANPAGLEAAIVCAQMGCTVTVLAETDHIGGMMTGGLSAVDIQIPEWSGLVVGAGRKHQLAVGAELALRDQSFYTQGYAAPPNVVERVYRRRLAIKGLTVVPNARLTGVTSIIDAEGGYITSITAGGVSYSARTYIDASYTGDLVQRALPGSSIRIGRKPVTINVTDKDSLNGIRPTADTPQFMAGVSPYIIPGDSNSGPCKGIWPNEVAGTVGAESPWVMAFCYRVTACQTGDAAGTYTKLPMPEPTVYDPADWELLARDIVADVLAGSTYTKVSGYVSGVAERTRNRLLEVPLVGTTMVDINNGSWVMGTNHVSPECTEYLTASYERRAEIEQRVKDRFLGFFKFLRTDPRLPAGLRADAASYGLPSGIKNFEQMYVRVGPQIIGDKVLTDNRLDTPNTTETEGVSVCYYSKDSHTVRVYVSGGQVYREGNMLAPVYGNGNPLPFWVTKPKRAEARNLLSLFAMSTSMSVMCSARMEPELQSLGEAAGIAAALAAQRKIAVHDVLTSEIQAIQDRFGFATKGGAILAQDGAAPFNGGTVTTAGTWSVSPTAPIVGHAAHAVSNGADVTGSVAGTALTLSATAAGTPAIGQYVNVAGVPDGTTITSGSGNNWTLSAAGTVAGGTAIRLSNGRKDFAFNLGATGTYDLYVWFVVKASSTRSATAPFDVFHAGGTASLTLDQNAAGEGGNRVYLGRYTLRKGATHLRVHGAAGGSVIELALAVPVV